MGPLWTSVSVSSENDRLIFWKAPGQFNPIATKWSLGEHHSYFYLNCFFIFFTVHQISLAQPASTHRWIQRVIPTQVFQAALWCLQKHVAKRWGFRGQVGGAKSSNWARSCRIISEWFLWVIRRCSELPKAGLQQHSFLSLHLVMGSTLGLMVTWIRRAARCKYYI